MVRPAPREIVNFRMGPVGKVRLDNLAAKAGVDRSEAIRACLAVAMNHEKEVLERLKEEER